MVGEFLGGALVLIGLTMLLFRHRIESSAAPPSGAQTRAWNKQGLDNGRIMALACSLLILGGTVLILGAALTRRSKPC
mgnify:CR=1 FL=1|jgi:hypothetical protein